MAKKTINLEDLVSDELADLDAPVEAEQESVNDTGDLTLDATTPEPVKPKRRSKPRAKTIKLDTEEPAPEQALPWESAHAALQAISESLSQIASHEKRPPQLATDKPQPVSLSVRIATAMSAIAIVLSVVSIALSRSARNEVLAAAPRVTYAERAEELAVTPPRHNVAAPTASTLHSRKLRQSTSAKRAIR